MVKALGGSTRSVQLWTQKSAAGRRSVALKTGQVPRAKPKLDAPARRLQLLAAGSQAAGFAGQLWTCRQLGGLIRRKFGVSCHVRHLPALLESLGWSVQKPKRRAWERNQSAIDAASEQHLLQGFISATRLPIQFALKTRMYQSEYQ